jgi:hypothetical protein
MAVRVPYCLLADLVRVGAAVSAVAALVGIPSLGDGARFLLVLLVLMVPRVARGVPAPLDLAFGVTLLGAAWSSSASWYAATPAVWLVHAVTTGLTAIVLHLVLGRAGVLSDPLGRARAPRAEVVAWTAALGLVVGVIWETARWFRSVTLPALSADPVAGLAAPLLVDVAGALVAGLGLAVVRTADGAGARATVRSADRAAR